MSVIRLNEQNFEIEVSQSKLPVLVDFFADWCGPCQMAGPILEELSKEYEGKIKFAKINIDQSSQTASKYNVMSIPTVVIFKNGVEVERVVGFPGKEGYLDLINKIFN